MRTVLAALLVLVACTPNRPRDVVTYFDRNDDGVADFEYHNPGCYDCEWALIDSDFNGRYEKRVVWGYTLVKETVNVPIPKNVVLVVGQPPVSGWD